MGPLLKRYSYPNLSDESFCVEEIDFDIIERNAYAYLNSVLSPKNIFREFESRRLLNRGDKYWRTRNKNKALKYFVEALEIYPVNTDVIGMLGDYYEDSDYDKSMKFYELAVSLGSLRKKDYYQLADFYTRKGYHTKANNCYNQWEELKKNRKICG